MAETPPEVTEIFNRMAGLLFSEETLQSTLDVAVSLARDTIEGTAGAGVTLVREGHIRTAAYSDGDVVQAADDAQYELAEGPCLSAIRDNRAYRIDSMPDETRWPTWKALAASLGMMSALSVPLRVRAEVIGAVKVYSRYPGLYDERHARILQMLADQAAIVLTNVQSYTDAQQLSDQLREALITRQMIGQATGILMERERIDDEAAFAMLRQASQNQNIKLREIAREVVGSVQRAPEL